MSRGAGKDFTNVQVLRDELVRHVQWSQVQQERAEQAEQRVKELQRQLDKRAQEDIFHQALEENYDKLKSMYVDLLKDRDKYKQNATRLSEECQKLAGNVAVSNYMLKLQTIFLKGRGLNPMDDPVFSLMVRDALKRISEEDATLFEAFTQVYK